MIDQEMRILIIHKRLIDKIMRMIDFIIRLKNHEIRISTLIMHMFL